MSAEKNTSTTGEGGTRPATSGRKGTETSSVKFGWIEGVFVRCLQSIIGIILYLRLSWVVAQAGIVMGVAIVLLSSVVTVLTTISTSTLCTNGEMKGGGLYYLISRTLGAEYGGSIGLLFSMANCVGGGLYVVGFAETVRHLLYEAGIVIIDGEVWDVRLISVVTCVLLMAIIFWSTAIESKLQQALLVPLLLSILSFIIGSFIPTAKKEESGFTGYQARTFAANSWPDFRDGHSFFSIFSIYFPAATGIMAGANISGDLKNPQAAIPRGTLSAIAVSTVIYITFVLICGSTYVRDADGVSPIDADHPPICALNSSCPYGLHNYYQTVMLTSVWPPMISIGIVVSSLCSAMGGLVSAPKVFQAVCHDRLIPSLFFFAKGYGLRGDPRRAYALALLVTVLVVMVGDLNYIAPFISNFFLCSYALVNYACFLAIFSQTPGFRPAFRFYSPWLSLLGAVMCMFIMFIMSWVTTLITFIFFAVVFVVIKHLKPDVNWGTSTTATTYKHALSGVMKLTKDEPHVKNYRPQILVLSGVPHERPHILEMASSITRGTSLLVCGNVIVQKSKEMSEQLTGVRKIEEVSQAALRRQGVRGISKTVVASTLEEGCLMLYQLSKSCDSDFFLLIGSPPFNNLQIACGLGRMTPNIVLLGFPGKNSQDGRAQLSDFNAYLQIIQQAFYSGMGVAVLRRRAAKTTDSLIVGETQLVIELSSDLNQEIPSKTITKKPVIDVWWLSDDGGLTLLVPYLLTLKRSHLEGANLRIFTVAPQGVPVSMKEKSMASLLQKFRIHYTYLHVVPAFTTPDEEAKKHFLRSLQPFKGETEPGMISEEELTSTEKRSNRHIHTGSLLRHFSSEADLVVVTLPFPHKNISSGLYLSWLEAISRDLSSVLLIRGNHSNVLTFYS
ncbi:hypothetical protein Q1695_013717 [Nippostrongylus brasiliensis]|nr:hypothetical protein Q1695_013717 [Nippostrongylus brasiliensis]